MWIGHVAKMKRSRLPRTMLFGWRKEINKNQTTKQQGQIEWTVKVMREARITEIDWLR